MTLSELTKQYKPIEVLGSTEIEISGIELDSRKCKPGSAFVAIRGTQADGHTYIEKAISLGANCIICENLPQETNPEVTYAVYNNTADIVGPLATTFYGNPTKRMKLVGITGTNGKTTIATTLYNIIRRMGIKAGLCSTVCNYIGRSRAYRVHNTRPHYTEQIVGQNGRYGMRVCLHGG